MKLKLITGLILLGLVLLFLVACSNIQTYSGTVTGICYHTGPFGSIPKTTIYLDGGRAIKVAGEITLEIGQDYVLTVEHTPGKSFLVGTAEMN